VRRIVRDRVAASIEREKARLEEYVAQRLQYLDGFPYALNDPVISIREVRSLKLKPLARADYPPLDIEVILFGSLAAGVRNNPKDLGPSVFGIDVQLNARGTVRGDGTYSIAPQSATLKAWWRGMEPGC
jgi:hypothetical protein